MALFKIPRDQVQIDEKTGAVYLKLPNFYEVDATPLKEEFDIPRGPGVMLPEGMTVKSFGMDEFFKAHAEWSQSTFGADNVRGPVGPLKHLVKEVLVEILGFPQGAVEAFLILYDTGGVVPPNDIIEYADCQLLLLDAVRRAGFTYDSFLASCWKKLEVNKKRSWNITGPNDPVEHVRSYHSDGV